MLLVDAAQGIEAQTLANLYLAMENDLTIIPVLNKIDLPAAQPEKYAEELAGLIGGEPEDCLRVSGKTGEGVEPLLDEIVAPDPAPDRRRRRTGAGDDLRLGLRHLPRRRHLRPGHRRQPQPARADRHDVDAGHPRAARDRRDLAGAGPVEGSRRRRGRLPHHRRQGRPPVPGRRHRHQRGQARRQRRSAATATPSRWSSPGSTRSTGPTTPTCATRSTSSSSTTPRWSTSRRRRRRSASASACGFLGLLHLEIVRERLEREFDLDLISTLPNVVYDVTLEGGVHVDVTNPSEFPDGKISEVREPVVRATILAPSEFVGAIMELCQQQRGAAARHGLPLARSGSSCATRCRSPRSSSTSSTS